MLKKHVVTSMSTPPLPPADKEILVCVKAFQFNTKTILKMSPIIHITNTSLSKYHFQFLIPSRSTSRFVPLGAPLRQGLVCQCSSFVNAPYTCTSTCCQPEAALSIPVTNFLLLRLTPFHSTAVCGNWETKAA